MSKILTEFPKHRGRPPVYDWAKWTNGEVHELTRGEDFDCDPRSFRTLVHRTKKSRGLSARTKFKGDNVIVIQFTKGE
jgi:hypothetical protein